jgi:hypothetical protein
LVSTAQIAFIIAVEMLSLSQMNRSITMFNKFAIVCAVAFLMTANVWAEDKEALVQPPVIPEPLADGQTIEPEVNIVNKSNGDQVQEYRVNGQLYMIKVTPARGYPYYLMDTDGDGSLETTQHELDSGLLIPNWILLEW